MSLDRWIDFEGLLNFRDVGELTGRPGLLYRSDALCGLVDGDRAAYEALGVRTVIDLRRPEEVEGTGRAPDWAYAQWHNLTLREEVWPVSDCKDPEEVAGYLAEVYLRMNPGDLVSVLTVLADDQTGPVVVHCMGGRDRTGVVVAVLLELIGVPDEQIAADYAETERFTRRWLSRHLETTGEEAVLPANILHTPPQAILKYFAALRQRHGSIREFVVAAGLAPEAIDGLRTRLGAV